MRFFAIPSGLTADCAAHGVPAPLVTWHRLSDGMAIPVGLRSADEDEEGDAATGGGVPLARALPHNNSLRLRPFHAREFDPSLHSEAEFVCVARSQSGAVKSRRLKVKAGQSAIKV